jgi:hypothetical protein
MKSLAKVLVCVVVLGWFVSVVPTVAALELCVDTLKWFAAASQTRDNGPIDQYWQGSRDWGSSGFMYSTKGGSPYLYEYHLWDPNYIYLHFDSSNWPDDPYSWDFGVPWMPRWWCVGGTLEGYSGSTSWHRHGPPEAKELTWECNKTDGWTNYRKMTFLSHEPEYAGNLE